MIEQIKTVKKLIDKERNVLRKIAQDPEADPIIIDGITSKMCMSLARLPLTRWLR